MAELHEHHNFSNSIARTLQVEERRVCDLKAYDGNPRIHSKKQIAKIAASLREFGFVYPILVDQNDTVIAGHALLEATKLLGHELVPVVRHSDLSDSQVKALRITLNRLSELADWDPKHLAAEFRSLLEIDFPMDLTGFETPEIDMILVEGDEASEADPADEIPEISETSAVSRLGDLWLPGAHRLVCGDALDPAAYTAALAGEKAQAVFTDPPYNVPIRGHVSGLGKVRHREFPMATGEMSEDGFTAFLRTVAGHLASNSIDGSIHFIFMDWRHSHTLQTACRDIYAELKNVCIWDKNTAGMGSLYRSQHELVFVYKNGIAPHVNNVQLGKHGRYRTNVWGYPGINSFGSGRDEALKMHPTVKPVALVSDAILDVTKRNALVLDPFSGSGTTIMAAERTGRRGAAIELDPVYVDATIRRFQKHVGKPVMLAETGQTFHEVAAARTEPGEDA